MFSQSSRQALLRYVLFNVFTSMAFFSAVLTPMYTDWAGLPEEYLSRIQAWFMVGGLILDVPTGIFADRYGRKLSLMLGAFVCACGLVLYGSYPSVYVFVAGEFILALGTKLMNGADSALLYASVPELEDPELHARTTRTVLIIRRITMIAGSLIGGVIASRWGLNYPIICSAIPLIVAVIIALGFTEVRGEHVVTIKDALQEGYRHVRHNECVRGLMVQMMLSAIPGYFVLWLYQLLLRWLSVDVSYFAVFHSGLLVSQIAVLLSFKWLVRLIGSERRYLVTTALIGATVYALAAYAITPLTVGLYIVVGGLFVLTRNDVLRGYINPHVTREYQATVVSYVGMMSSILVVVMNIVVSMIIGESMTVTLLIIGVFALLSLLVVPKAECFEKRQ